MSYLWLLRETHIFAVLKLLNRLCQEKEKWASRSWSFWIRLGNPQTNVSVFVQSFSYKYDPNDALLIVFFLFLSICQVIWRATCDNFYHLYPEFSAMVVLRDKDMLRWIFYKVILRIFQRLISMKIVPMV